MSSRVSNDAQRLPAELLKETAPAAATDASEPRRRTNASSRVPCESQPGANRISVQKQRRWRRPRAMEIMPEELIKSAAMRSTSEWTGLMLIFPFLAGMIYVACVMISGRCISGATQTSWTSAPSNELEQCVPLWQMANFWMAPLFGGVPFLLQCYLWVALITATEASARDALASEAVGAAEAKEAADEAGEGETPTADSSHGKKPAGARYERGRAKLRVLRNDRERREAHVEMVRLGKRFTKLEVVLVILLFCYLALCVPPVLYYGFLRWGIPSVAGRLAFTAIVGFLCLSAVPFGFFLCRTLRVTLLRQHGNDIMNVLSRMKRSFGALMIVELSCLGYLVSLGSSSPLFTSALALLGDADEPDPCDIASAPTYASTYCKLQLGFTVQAAGPTLRCDDGGWHEYTSAAVACSTSLSYFDAVTKQYSAFALSINAFSISVIQEQLQSLPKEPRYPKTTFAAQMLIFVTHGLLFPIYVGFLVQGYIKPSILALGVHDLWVLLVNCIMVSNGIILLNVETLKRRLEALVAGSELMVHAHDGQPPAPLRKMLSTAVGAAVRQEEEALLAVAIAEGEAGGGSGDGDGCDIESGVAAAAAKLAAAKLAAAKEANRFTGEPRQLISGKPEDAALGVNHYMRVTDVQVWGSMGDDGGLSAVVAEFEAAGTADDLECLDYVLRQKAGSSNKTFQEGLQRDMGRNGETLDDFVRHRFSATAKLSKAHVLALRLYTTAAFRSINNPLRDTRENRRSHPFPVTVNLIKDGISRLRAVAASDASSNMPLDLWRGLRDTVLAPTFLSEGGTELAPMSTTTALSVAVQYARSSSSVLFKLHTTSFMQRGADLDYLSAFPGEREILFPPLTYLSPTGRTMSLVKNNIHFEVVEVVPIMP